MTSTSAQPDFPFGRSAMILAGLVGVGMAGAWGVLAVLGLENQIGPMFWLGVMAFIGGVAALVPIALLARRSDEGVVQGAMLSLLARMGLTLAGAVLVAQLTGYTHEVIAGWTIGWYLLLLTAEVGLIVRHLRHMDATAPQQGGSAC